MDVIDRYFRTLRLLLPKDQRDDIIRELSEEVRSQIVDREAALGRPLTSEEHATLISQYGHPLVTAARYWPQRYLIGPIVFPHYWMALKIVLGLMVVGHAAGAAVLVASGTPVGQLGASLENAIGNMLKVVGWMTALAAWLDLWLSRSNVLKSWRPDVSPRPHQLAEHAIANALRSLPDPRRPTPPSGAASPSEPSISGLVLATLVSAWWLAGLKMPSLFFGSGAAHLEWGPAMNRVYPVLVAAQLAVLVDRFVRIRAREAAVILGLTRVVWLAGGWMLIYLVATSDHQWMVWRDGGVPSPLMQIAGRDLSVVEFVNYIWSTIFVFVAVLSAWSSMKGLIRRLRRPPRPAHA